MGADKADAGALSPLDAAEKLFQTGLHHLYEPTQLTFLKNVYGGLLFGFAGLFSLIAAAGVPGLEESNPGLPKLLQGATFPLGLVIVYGVGAELFTGYPMWLVMTALRRKGKIVYYMKSLVVSWVGNLAGVLVSAFFFSYLTKTLHEDPFRSGLIQQVTSDIVEAAWHVIFLKAIGCGFLMFSFLDWHINSIVSVAPLTAGRQVTLAMFFGTQNQDGISKALGLHLPFFISTSIRFPHLVEYMYLASIGMMLGAPLSVGAFLWKCLLPITLGNTMGGAVFVGTYNWWVYLHCEDGERDKSGGLRLDDDMGVNGS